MVPALVSRQALYRSFNHRAKTAQLSGQLVHQSRCFHIQCLGRPVVIVVAEPSPQRLASLLKALKVVKPQRLLFHGASQPLNHAALLWRVRADELLFDPILIYRLSVSTAAKHQAVI